jgi:PAS domain S-box-containing protein
VPIIIGKDIFGNINVSSNRKFNQNEKEILKIIAAYLSVVLELRHCFERYKALFNCMPHVLILLSPDGRVRHVNRRFTRLTQGYGECFGRHICDLIHPGDTENVERALAAALSDGQAGVEVRLMTGDGDFIFTDLMVIHNSDELLCIFTDISDRKMLEYAERRRDARFSFSEGSVYLVQEKSICSSAEVLKEMMHMGYYGVVFSDRESSMLSRIMKDHEHAAIPERMGNLEKSIESLPKKSAVLITDFEQLVTIHGTARTLKLLKKLSSIASERCMVIMIQLDPDALSGRQLRLIEKRTNELEPDISSDIDESALEILRLVYSINKTGRKPKYADICRRIKMSKPTVRKKIRFLISHSYVSETKKGRCKLLSITDRGIKAILGDR